MTSRSWLKEDTLISRPLCYLIGLILLLSLWVPARAVVLQESKVLSFADLQKLGVQVEVGPLPGPVGTRKIRIAVHVAPGGKVRTLRSLGFSVLDKVPDADFSSAEPKKAAKRDAKAYAKETRSGSTTQSSFNFTVSDAELPRTYLLVQFDLPPEKGKPVVAGYYVVFTTVTVDTKHTEVPPEDG